MASETLEERKPEDEAPAEEVKEELKPEVEEAKEDNKEEENKENKEEEEGGEATKHQEDAVVADTDVKDEESEDKNVEAGGEEKKKVEEGEASKKGKRGGRRGSSKKDQSEPKNKTSQVSTEEENKEPVTPATDRPTRERKTVERYSVPSPGRSAKSSASKGLSIEKGRGTQLKDIPNVAFKLSKRKTDDNLQVLHTILFGKKAKAQILKRNISQFSGYVWAENEEKQRAKVKEKLDKCVKEKLMDFCDVLNIPINKSGVKKEELSVKLLEFLESPHVTTDTLLADKEQKGQKRRRKVTPSNIASSGEAPVERQPKKQKQMPQVSKKRKQSSEVEEDDEVDDKVEYSDAKDEAQDDDNDSGTVPNEESDHEETKSEEEDDEPKEKMSKSSSKKVRKDDSAKKVTQKPIRVKKATPAKTVKTPAKPAKKSSLVSKRGTSDADGTSGSHSKSKGPTTKKQKVEKESQDYVKEKDTGKKHPSKSQTKVSARDQGKIKSSKKAKTEPSREEMHAVVVDILKDVDFNTATLSDILRQLGTHFGVDLMHRKAEVKDIITDVINNMSDEEEDGEEAEENVEAGDDADNDDDA